MTLERLETAYNEALRILQGRNKDGRKYVPILQHLERELQMLRSSEDDYDRYLKL